MQACELKLSRLDGSPMNDVRCRQSGPYMDDVHRYVASMNLHGAKNGRNSTSEGLLEILTPRSSFLDVGSHLGSPDTCHLTLLLQALDIEQLPNGVQGILIPDARNLTAMDASNMPPVMLPGGDARGEDVDRERAAGEPSATRLQCKTSPLERTRAGVVGILPPCLQVPGCVGDRADDASCATTPLCSGEDVSRLAGRGGTVGGWEHIQLDIVDSEVHLGEFPLLVDSHSTRKLQHGCCCVCPWATDFNIQALCNEKVGGQAQCLMTR
jgi:hypothetical protein